MPQPNSQPFNRISSRYQLVNRIISLGIDLLWRRSTIKSVDIRHGDRVLDLGSGPGDLLELIPSTCIKIGVDPEPGMLREARIKFQALKAIGEKLPITSASIDKVVSAFVLRNLQDRATTFSEIERVLVIGGRGALIDFSPPSLKSVANPLNFYLKFIIPTVGGLISGDFEAYRYLSRTIMAFPQPIVIESELRSAGLSEVTSKRLIGHVAVLYIFRK